MIYLLECPECHTKFEYKPPTVEYLEPVADVDDSAPAKCPLGHIRMYQLSGARIKNA